MGAVIPSFAQHLWWKMPAGVKYATCVYGQIKVLATHSNIYYCGCNWNPGEPAGGYTGIQDKGNGIHNMIFSIWDTSPTLHPSVSYAGNGVNAGRFGGEGTGAHTDAVIGWKTGKFYEFLPKKFTTRPITRRIPLCTSRILQLGSGRTPPRLLLLMESTLYCISDCRTG